MRYLKVFFDFYINSSIHVALSCYSLVCVTQILFAIPYSEALGYFCFFGTIVGYNFVKYEALIRTKKFQIRNQLRLITLFSFCSFIVLGYYFFQLKSITQIVAITFLGFTLLYTVPFFPNKNNARNWAGVKIYIVSLCWAGVTVILPVLNADIVVEKYFYAVIVQRFILIFVLILIFEIIDLRNDNLYLQTIPQQIGVKRTKQLGFLLMLLFCVLNALNIFNNQYLILNFSIVSIIMLFLAFANEWRPKYYTSFWAESIPILWLILLILFKKV